MSNNSININKTNNNLSPKIIDQQYRRWKAYDVGNSGAGLGQAQKCGGIKPVDD